MRVVIFIVHLLLAIWLLSIAFKDTSCHNKPTYSQTGPDLARVPFNTFVLGSWVNIITTLTVVEWIAAGFALYFMDLPNYLDPTNDENLGLHSTILLSTAWNLVFLVILWMKYDTLNIPPNNIFIYVLAICAATAVQNLMGRAQIDPKKDVAPRSYEPVFDTNIFFNPRSYSHHKHLEFHDRSYARHLDMSVRGMVCRLCEGAIITPLLYMTLIALVPGSLTWVIQIVFAAQIVLNLNLILAQFSVENPTLVYIYRTNALLLILIVATGLYGPNFFVIFGGNSPTPVYVKVFYFLLIVAWIAYVVVFVMEYTHRFRHDLVDWIGLVVKVIFVAITAMHICDTC